MKPPLASLLAISALVLGIPLSSLRAADGTWNTAASANYSGTANWAGGIVATGTGATMNYLATGNSQTITIDTPVTLGSIVFNNNSTSTQSRDVTLAVGAGSLTFDTGSSAPALVELLSSGGSGARNLNLGPFTVTGTSGLEIRNSATQGEQRVRFSSTTSLNGGVLTLTNNQSTILDIRATTSNPFGTSSMPDVVFAGSGTTSITTSTGVNLTFGTINGTNTNAFLSAAAGQSITYGGASNGSFAGRLVGAGTFVKSGAGVQTLTGANTYTGATVVSAGTLLIGSTGSIASSVIGFDVFDSSAGLLTLENTAFSFTGTLNLNLSAVSANNASWTLFNGSVFGAGDLNLSSITNNLSGLTFVNNSGVWSGVDGLGRTWSFNEDFGQLTVIPEPGTIWTVLAASLLVMLTFRHKNDPRISRSSENGEAA